MSEHEIEQLEALWQQPTVDPAHELDEPLDPSTRDRVRTVLGLDPSERLGKTPIGVTEWKRCGQPKKDGTPCRNRIAPEHIACHIHAPALIAAQDAEQNSAHPSTPSAPVEAPKASTAPNWPTPAVSLHALPDWATPDERELIDGSTEQWLDEMQADGEERHEWRSIVHCTLDLTAPPSWWRTAPNDERGVVTGIYADSLRRQWWMKLPGGYTLRVEDRVTEDGDLVTEEEPWLKDGPELRPFAMPSGLMADYQARLEEAAAAVAYAQHLIRTQERRHLWDGQRLRTV